MECIAHRGFAGEHPENTVGAVESAAAVADWIEVDVRRCGSGEPVVIHDATVDRVTGASGAVADFTVDELAALDVLESGEGVPTFSDVLAAIPPSVGVDVELKERGLGRDVAESLADRDGPVLVSSFDDGAIERLREGSDLPVGLIAAEAPDDALARAGKLECAAVSLHHECCRPEVVEAAHEGGMTVYAWTMRERAVVERSVDAGVDGLIADRPEFCDVA